MFFKKILMLVLLVGNMGAAQIVSAHTDSDAPKIVLEWEKFWNTYDLSKLNDLFVNDDSITYFSSERPGLIKGFDAVVKHYEGFGFVPGGTKQPSKLLWLKDINTRYMSNGSLIIVGADWYFKTVTDGVEKIGKGPVTFICVKGPDGKYKIQHVHFANY